MIFVISTVNLKSGAREACLAAARPCIAGTVKEDGCLSYDVHVSVTDPDKIVFVERWESRAHLDAHMKTPHFLVWREQAPQFIASRRVEIITPQDVAIL
ncbi:MAG: antibiotic biosynthesis monooxygenase [Alphaproteobacteria bacterium]|nr:antibiotic biosynthesis monooxygenase [Alphaproteobacteria bacterium]